MKEKIGFFIFKYFTLIIIFFCLIQTTNFAKNLYFVNKYNFNKRISKNYNICGDGSFGFLHFIKTKYKLNKKLKILDYQINPNPGWIFFNLNNEIYQDKLALLNYEKKEEIQLLKLEKNLFTINKNPPFLFKIEKVIFHRLF